MVLLKSYLDRIGSQEYSSDKKSIRISKIEYVDNVRTITGKIVFKDFEGGFWGIEAGENYLPIRFPEQLKSIGAHVICTIHTDPDLMSFISWGEPCHILSFSTLYI